jgi:hypothetical protein
MSKLDDLIQDYEDENPQLDGLRWTPIVTFASALVEAIKEEINSMTARMVRNDPIGEIDLAFKRIKGEKE